MNFEGAMRGMRNPMNSWDKSMSYFEDFNGIPIEVAGLSNEEYEACLENNATFVIGDNDQDLARTLCTSGSDHGKLARQIFVCADITAPLYWYKEFDTYKIGTTANSTSTMHKIHAKPLSVYDFSCEDLDGYIPPVELFPNEINEETEVWGEHPDFSLYRISNQGRVERKTHMSKGRKWTSRFLTNTVQEDGYLRVSLVDNDGNRVSKAVHVLVAEVFIPNPEHKPEVNHKNGNKQFNIDTNLEWSTRAENQRHAHLEGLQRMTGVTAYKISEANSKFSDEERANIILEYRNTQTSYRKLAKKYGVSHTCIKDVVNGTYQHVELNEFEKFKLEIEELEDLRLRYMETKNKSLWRQLIQRLPSSFNQTRTVTLDYENLRNIYFARRHHKLTEWHTLCHWIEGLPYSFLITEPRVTPKEKHQAELISALSSDIRDSIVILNEMDLDVLVLTHTSSAKYLIELKDKLQHSLDLLQSPDPTAN